MHNEQRCLHNWLVRVSCELLLALFKSPGCAHNMSSNPVQPCLAVAPRQLAHVYKGSIQVGRVAVSLLRRFLS